MFVINKSEFINLMAAKGTAGKSASGASMSKYDMEVEERLQALEKKVHDHDEEVSVDDDLKSKVDELYDWFKNYA